MNFLSILLVDDDEIERMKFKKVCNDNNCRSKVVEAIDGKQALRILNNAEHSFNIIIMDLHMPEMNGLDFLSNLKSNVKFRNIPIIVMSNSEDDTELKKCYDFGVSGFFTKPLQFSAYSKKVESLLNYWKENKLINE
ncbi:MULTISPECIES: response regulator [Polaribacter]|uniref:Response regulator n=2 Tax=Polaribacter sejongensis TaxID=985043 RepID=A0AAJ1QX54_9FLAO|nr:MULTISPECIES: response regulator [Polaribacter]MDN3619667.1 response regulator [Polaribacter undariae]UWD31435.1 response regulator [Polaribacter undariae]